ncbi:hypothetical protein PpBr36_06982 [Pyricularia pennisetigena]|uniref:hypothetical protein n=1 Tax=Pyricularia pennisetigena TaxID=1578925 RepID=UPI00115218DD|nr:hypothetical protein PpBr36_06982 [Pyricularia pennisetigena]TLS25194.1 hypothetical protein PpBr36_06982 [Pyricularia pennisetigena]
MRVNRFLVPLMAGSVVSAPVPESEPKHQLEVRMNSVPTAVVGGVAACIACAVGIVGYKSYKIAQQTFQLTTAKYALDMASTRQAMEIASENQKQTQGKALMDALKAAIDMKTKVIDDNIEVIKKADAKNKFAMGYTAEVAKLKSTYTNELVRGANEFPITSDSVAVKGTSAYCAGLQKLLEASISEMEKVVAEKSRSPSPVNPPAGSNPVSPGSLSRSNSMSRTGGNTGGSPAVASPAGRSRSGSLSSSGDSTGGKGRQPSVASSLSSGAAALRSAEEGSYPTKSLQRTNTHGATSGSTSVDLSNSQTLINRPTRKLSTDSIKDKPAKLNRRMVQRVGFDV